MNPAIPAATGRPATAKQRESQIYHHTSEFSGRCKDDQLLQKRRTRT
jgi:hypothetical protein